jgi:hydrogenase/urease accessory protein HupE
MNKGKKEQAARSGNDLSLKIQRSPRRYVRSRTDLAWRIAASLLVSIVLAGNADAHQTKLSSTRMTIASGDISTRIELNGIDLNVATGKSLTMPDGQVQKDQLVREIDAVHRYVDAHVGLGFEDGPDCVRSHESALPKDDHVVLTANWQCPKDSRALVYRVALFHEIDPASRHMVSVDGDAKFIGLLSVSTPQMSVTQAVPAAWQTFLRYLVSGIEHIAIGYDHIAFLLAVIVLARRFWPLFKVITAFTIAHSITLTLAVFDIVSLPSRLVETLIAASIVYVAAENFFVKDIRHRWWLTFAFGLMHGFGFASVLRDYGLPRDALGLALAAFNIGVEIGQLLIVVAAVIVWRVGFMVAEAGGLVRTEAVERRVSLAISTAVLVAGLYWLAERGFWV